MPKRIFLPILIVFIFTVFSADKVFACLCASSARSPMIKGGTFLSCGIYWDNDVVFIGRVDKITYEETEENGRKYKKEMTAHISVAKAVRGVKKGETIEVKTRPAPGLCGYPFIEGEAYFVYLKRRENGEFTEYLCGPTVLLKYAQDDLEYLRAIENGETGGRIYGNIINFIKEGNEARPTNTPLSGIQLTAKSIRVKNPENYLALRNKSIPKFNKREFTSYTDKNGFYLFKELPLGFYEVEAKLSSNLRIIEPMNKYTHLPFIYLNNERNRCVNKNFGVTSLENTQEKLFN